MTIAVLANDSDPDGDTLSVASATQGRRQAGHLAGRSALDARSRNVRCPSRSTVSAAPALLYTGKGERANGHTPGGRSPFEGSHGDILQPP